MTTQPTNASKPKRRWLRYSLRTLLIVITLFGVWLGTIVKQARDQKRAVEAIQAFGGAVLYEHELSDGITEILTLDLTGMTNSRSMESDSSTDTAVPPPDWGEEIFSGTTAGSSESVLLGPGDALEVSGEESDVPQLALQPEEPRSRADRTAEQPVEENPTTTAWNFRPLKGSDSAISHSPEWLRDWLGEEYFVTVVEVQFLGTFGKIELTDSDLRHVSRLRNLRRLRLEDTQITDAGLQHLERLTQLELLDLRGTQATEAGVKQLQQALPDCEIIY